MSFIKEADMLVVPLPPKNITPKGSTQPPLKLPVTNNAMRQCKAEETLKELMLVLQEIISMETGEAPWWVM